MSSAIAAKSAQVRSTCRNVKECLSSMRTFWQRTVDGSLAARPLTSVMPPEGTRCALTDRGAHRPLNDPGSCAHRKPKSISQQRSWRRSRPVSRGDARPNDKNAIAQLAPVRYENATRWVCFFGSSRKCRRWCSVPDGTGGNRGGQPVCYGRVIAVGMLIASAIVLPTSEASARCWHNGWGWRCGPGLLALPFVAAGAVVAGAAAVATAPVRAIFGPPYYAPPPAYYAPPPYYPPAYYPPAYYYGTPPR
jgi:hypothetical protein